jgi:uncharacterized lipoprotein YmbA
MGTIKFSDVTLIIIFKIAMIRCVKSIQDGHYLAHRHTKWASSLDISFSDQLFFPLRDKYATKIIDITEYFN